MLSCLLRECINFSLKILRFFNHDKSLPSIFCLVAHTLTRSHYPLQEVSGRNGWCAECLDDSLCCTQHGRPISPCRKHVVNHYTKVFLSVSAYLVPAE